MNDRPHISRVPAFISSCWFVTGLLTLFLTTPVFAAWDVKENVAFESTPCWNEVEGEATTDCGWLIVPEDWNAPQSQTLKLPVAIYRPLKPDTSLSPIIYLAGGPGGHPLGENGKYMDLWRRGADYGFPGRTLIVFDQRGTGLGSPRLGCDNAKDPAVWRPLMEDPDETVNVPARVHAAMEACFAEHLKAGRKLQAFNTRQNATDVEALRHALGLKPIILYGVSYGTLLALTVMKLYPDNIESAILDSPFPPQAEYAGSDANTFGPVLDRLFAACRQYADCEAAYPDLRGRLLRALDQLEQEPTIVEIVNLRGKEPLYARVDHRMFLLVLRLEMYHTPRLPNLPVLISGVAQGEYWRLKQHVENVAYGYFPDNYDTGAMLAVMCNDDAGATDQADDDTAGAYAYLNDYANWFRDYPLCEFWPGRPESRNRDAVVSDIPSLLLAGGLDASTTVEQAEMAAETLVNSHLFVFPANAHVQLRRPCAREVLNEFLANPKLRPNPACLTSLRQPAFITLGGN